MQDFRNLLVWQKAHRLGLDVYKASPSLPQICPRRIGLGQ